MEAQSNRHNSYCRRRLNIAIRTAIRETSIRTERSVIARAKHSYLNRHEKPLWERDHNGPGAPFLDVKGCCKNDRVRSVVDEWLVEDYGIVIRDIDEPACLFCGTSAYDDTLPDYQCFGVIDYSLSPRMCRDCQSLVNRRTARAFRNFVMDWRQPERQQAIHRIQYNCGKQQMWPDHFSARLCRFVKLELLPPERRSPCYGRLFDLPRNESDGWDTIAVTTEGEHVRDLMWIKQMTRLSRDRMLGIKRQRKGGDG